LYENVFRPEASKRIKKEELIKELYEARALLIKNHHSLYLNRLDSLIHKVKIFGTHFASLDIRQDSRIHTAVILQINAELIAKGKAAILPENYSSLTLTEKLEALSVIETIIDPSTIDDTITRDTLESMYAIKSIQKENGEEGCHRYVISNCQGVVNMMEVYALLRLCGWERENMNIDIVPLFETIDDLAQAETTMELLYTLPEYKTHLQLRHNHQTIMLGFSDGTKDGGYLQANWSIYTAKKKTLPLYRVNIM
jgi:phosphoenolpyruvate carboxylase